MLMHLNECGLLLRTRSQKGRIIIGVVKFLARLLLNQGGLSSEGKLRGSVGHHRGFLLPVHGKDWRLFSTIVLLAPRDPILGQSLCNSLTD